METLLKNFEKYISYLLIIVAMIFVAYQTIDLLWLFGNKLAYNFQNQVFEIETPGRPIAGLFFSILLIMEIIETIRVFAKDHSVKIRIILMVGLIAVTRKLLMMDIAAEDPKDELAIASLIIALSLGYFLVGRNVGAQRKEEQ